MVELSLPVINESLEQNCLLILSCVELIGNAPGIYHNLTKRVKKKTLNRILNSDAAHLVLNKAIKTANNHLQ